MTDNNLPAQNAAPVEPEKAKPQETQAEPKPQPVEEPFDPERAMNTIRQLREIEKKAKADAKELEQLRAERKKAEEAQLSEAERFKKQAEELAATNAKLQAEMLRRDVVGELGLPAALADRLKGSTREEMLEDGKKLLELLPKPKQPVQAVTNPGNASVNETEAEMRERIFGKQGNVWDIKSIEAGGGGVVWREKQPKE